MAPSTEMADFQKVFRSSNYIVMVTGAGVSAESGIPTFRGPGAFWRGFAVQTLASGEMFRKNPSLVWEFYHYRREIVFTKNYNPAHKAIADCEKQLNAKGRKLVVITQNIDEMHTKAGSKEVIELHGTLFKTRCTVCADVACNYDSPICPALEGKGSAEGEDAKIPEANLPRCQKDSCGGLLRPHIVWFDEDPTDEDMTQSYEWLDNCDLCIVAGTSSIVDPANEFAPRVAARGVPVAEFNLEATVATNDFQFHIAGPCGKTLKEAFETE